MTSHQDPAQVDGYLERTATIVPGLQDLHRMTALLLAEAAPAAARILVLGAGGGLELKALAERHGDWSFDGVDPSAPMLALARRHLGPLAARIRFHEGIIDNAPDGPFDGATCLLTLHFLPIDERRRTLRELARRLRPGAPLVVAQHSFASAEPQASRWLARLAAFTRAAGADAPSRSTTPPLHRQLPVLSPAQDVALLAEAGFTDIELFYAALTFRGWVARQPCDTCGRPPAAV